MEAVLKGMTKIVIDSKSVGNQGVLPYLPLSELRKRSSAGDAE